MELQRHYQKLKAAAQKEQLEVLDSCLYSLGVFTGSSSKYDLLDIELSLVSMAYLLPKEKLKAKRFLGPTVKFLQNYKDQINNNKLLKLSKDLSRVLEKDLPLMRLFLFVLDENLAQKFRTNSSEKLYLDQRFKESTDLAVKKRGLFLNMPDSLGLVLPEGSVRLRDSDLLPREVVLKRNEQLRNRFIFGPGFRADIAWWLKYHPETSARRLSKIFGMSYEPANRLSSQIRIAQAVGV